MSAALDSDTRFMALALRVAARGLGRTAPNPSVGAVVVRFDADAPKVVGRGWTQDGGRPHAETEALRRAGDAARGGTLYVTLEPCAHQGKTAPCVDAIVAAGIARVVAGVGDPDPRVAGKGFDNLRCAGIEVVTGTLEWDCAWTTLGHIRRVRSGRPFVQLKLAVSAEGLVPAAQNGQPTWVTGPAAKDWTHRLRSEADAILVGIGTVLADDPELTCRLPGLERPSPVRVVLDSQLRMPATSRIVQTAHKVPVWVLSLQSSSEGTLPPPVAVKTVKPGAEGGLDLADVLSVLARVGVTRVMVEGGPSLAGALIEAGLADEAIILTGRALAPGETGLVPFNCFGLEGLSAARGWSLHEHAFAGRDRIDVYRSPV